MTPFHKNHQKKKLLTLKKYISVDNTLENIKRLIERYYTENKLKVFDNWSLKKIHDYVRKLPYVPDPVKVPIYSNDDIELLKSPVMTITTNGGDCDDKAILLGSIFRRKGIKYRMKVVATEAGRDYHHIYPEIFYTDPRTGISSWVPFDATYQWNKMFVESPFVKARIYDWSCGDPVIFNITQNSAESHGGSLSCEAVKSIPQNKVPKSSFLNGVAKSLGLSGTRLAVLEGIPGGEGAHNYPHSKKIVEQRTAQLLGYGPGLGFDIASITAAAVGVTKLFSAIFGGREKYVDAYHAWATAEKDLNAAHAAWDAEGKPLKSANFDRVVADRAVLAVLSRDYMNPPLGPNFCTRPGDNYYCGNRAEWSKIKDEVETRAADFAPFLKWVNWEAGERHLVNWSNWGIDGLVQLYDQWKNKSGLVPQFVSARGKMTANKETKAGGVDSSTLLTLGILGVVGYMVFK